MRAELALVVAEAAVRRRRRSTRYGRGWNVPLLAFVIALAYFVWVALLGMNIIALPGLEPGIQLGDWVLGGVALMILLLLLLVVWAMGNRQGTAEGAVAEEPPAEYGPPRYEDELVVTAEEWRGMRVLEYSRPPKSEAPAAVYAKCYVPVDGSYVIRVEDRVAEARG